MVVETMIREKLSCCEAARQFDISDHNRMSSRERIYLTEGPVTLWGRIGSGFMESLKNLGKGLTEIFVFVVTRLPYLIPAAVIGAAVLLVVRLAGRKNKAQPENETKSE